MKKNDFINQFRLIRDYCKLGETKTIICLVVTCILEGIRPYVSLLLMGKLLDLVYSGAEYKEMIRMAVTAFGFVGLSSLVEAAMHKRYNGRLMGMFETQSYMMDRKCQSMDYEYLEDKNVHDMVFRVDRGEGGGFGMLGNMLSYWEFLIRSAVSIVAAVVVIFPLFVDVTRVRDGFMTSWLASLLLFAIIGFITVLNYILDVKYGEAVWEYREKASKHKNRLSYYMGILASYERQKDLRIFGQRQIIEEETDREINELDIYNKKEARVNFKRAVIKYTVAALSGLLVYVFAGVRAYLGLISIGSVVAYASSIVQMTNSMALFMQRMARLKNINRYVNDYVQFMALEKRKYDGSIPLEKRKDNKFSVEFEHVSFKYPGSEEYVIKDLNLNFVIGERMAIVGKNGSGKTTFIKLLCRLYDVTEGSIKVNGVDIRKYDYQEYCRLFAAVFQDFQMFAFPLGENIAGGEDVIQEKAVDALNRAGMGERLERLPGKLDTYVGKEFSDEGITFSGGEKQKMAIARAIYKDAPFVIMDEPTAALDPVSECEVFAGFDRMVGNKTAIYISHRLASCRFCQDIIVFDGGRVVQRGSHEELETQEGLYRELWEAQAKYYQ